MSNKLNPKLSAEKLLELADLSWDYTAGEVHDYSHSFNDLYDHRDTLFLCLLRLLFGRNNFNPAYRACKSKLHADGTNFEGYFIVMVTDLLSKEQISYHLSIEKYWDICDLEEVEKAPEWDGHSSDDVIERLTKWFL